MQVSLKTTTANTPSALQRNGVEAAPNIDRTPAPVTSRGAFPEAALLSRRPLRYNVQLNQQLTSVQQADDYLAKTETRLLQLRQAMSQGDAARQSTALQKHLAQREQLSGGTIDRHLTSSVQLKNSVNFALPGSEKLLQNPGGETLVFALGGRERQMAAITLPADTTPRQTLAQLNVGLGRLGIRAQQQNGNGQLTFQVAESQWEQVSQQLSVRGEGHHFPSDSFTLLAPQAEPASSDEMMQVAKGGERDSFAKIQKTLNHITSQRSQLRYQQDRVSSRIDDMSTAYSPSQALETSKALGQALGKSRGRFSSLSTALDAQANIGQSTVKNLLG